MRVHFIPESIRKVMSNLNREIRGIENRSLQGLVYSAIEIKRVAEPITPIDTGNLRHSFFIVTGSEVKEGQNPEFIDNPKKKKVTAAALHIDHAALLGEAQLIAGKKRKFPVVALGYSANYAAPVHEMEGANFNPPGQLRWFETAVKQVTPKVLEIIAKEAHVP